jgi:hypothetical protein
MTRSDHRIECPFLRREVDGKLFAPVPEPDANNRCAAIGVALPQSDRQQELVCLRIAHADCPRYLRGASSAGEAVRAGKAGAVPRATLVALLILVLSAGISRGFVVQRGGIDLPVAAVAPEPTEVAVAAAPPPTPRRRLAPHLAPPTVSTPAHPRLAVADPAPIADPRRRPGRRRPLRRKPCPDRRNAGLVVRSGNNRSIALLDIHEHDLQVEPALRGCHPRAGDEIRMPPPTRWSPSGRTRSRARSPPVGRAGTQSATTHRSRPVGTSWRDPPLSGGFHDVRFGH